MTPATLQAKCQPPRQLANLSRAAIASGNAPELRRLLDGGAPLSWSWNLARANNVPCGVLEHSARAGRLDCFSVALEATRASLGPGIGPQLLAWGAQSGSLPILASCIAALEARLGPPLSWINDAPNGFERGASALLISSARDNPACVELLLGLGADPLARDHEGANALERAVAGGSSDNLGVLIPLCDPDNKNNDGSTPLMLAIMLGNEDAVSMLAPISDPLALDAHGRPALLIAASQPRAPLGVLEALSSRMRAAAAPGRVLAEVAAAMAAAVCAQNVDGVALLRQIIESIAFKSELLVNLPFGKLRPLRNRSSI